MIVNYRTPLLAIDAVAALQEEVLKRKDVHVLVVENGSGDDSIAIVGEAIRTRGFDDWCTLLPLGTNAGFAAGNNAAVGFYREQTGGALPRLVWLLNPDTRAHPGAITALADFFAANPAAGVCGSRCVRDDGRAAPSTFRFHSPRTELNGALAFGPLTRLLGSTEVPLHPGDEPRRADWVTGASFMIRRELIESIGLMDDGYFLYFEETDYCARAAQAGFGVWTVPPAESRTSAGKRPE